MRATETNVPAMNRMKVSTSKHELFILHCFMHVHGLHDAKFDIAKHTTVTAQLTVPLYICATQFPG